MQDFNPIHPDDIIKKLEDYKGERGSRAFKSTDDAREQFIDELIKLLKDFRDNPTPEKLEQLTDTIAMTKFYYFFSFIGQTYVGKENAVKKLEKKLNQKFLPTSEKFDKEHGAPLQDAAKIGPLTEIKKEVLNRLKALFDPKQAQDKSIKGRKQKATLAGFHRAFFTAPSSRNQHFDEILLDSLFVLIEITARYNWVKQTLVPENFIIETKLQITPPSKQNIQIQKSSKEEQDNNQSKNSKEEIEGPTNQSSEQNIQIQESSKEEQDNQSKSSKEEMESPDNPTPIEQNVQNREKNITPTLENNPLSRKNIEQNIQQIEKKFLYLLVHPDNFPFGVEALVYPPTLWLTSVTKKYLAKPYGEPSVVAMALLVHIYGEDALAFFQSSRRTEKKEEQKKWGLKINNIDFEEEFKRLCLFVENHPFWQRVTNLKYLLLFPRWLYRFNNDAGLAFLKTLKVKKSTQENDKIKELNWSITELVYTLTTMFATPSQQQVQIKLFFMLFQLYAHDVAIMEKSVLGAYCDKQTLLQRLNYLAKLPLNLHTSAGMCFLNTLTEKLSFNWFEKNHENLMLLFSSLDFANNEEEKRDLAVKLFLFFREDLQKFNVLLGDSDNNNPETDKLSLNTFLDYLLLLPPEYHGDAGFAVLEKIKIIANFSFQIGPEEIKNTFLFRFVLPTLDERKLNQIYILLKEMGNEERVLGFCKKLNLNSLDDFEALFKLYPHFMYEQKGLSLLRKHQMHFSFQATEESVTDSRKLIYQNASVSLMIQNEKQLFIVAFWANKVGITAISSKLDDIVASFGASKKDYAEQQTYIFVLLAKLSEALLSLMLTDDFTAFKPIFQGLPFDAKNLETRIEILNIFYETQGKPIKLSKEFINKAQQLQKNANVHFECIQRLSEVGKKRTVTAEQIVYLYGKVTSVKDVPILLGRFLDCNHLDTLYAKLMGDIYAACLYLKLPYRSILDKLVILDKKECLARLWEGVTDLSTKVILLQILPTSSSGMLEKNFIIIILLARLVYTECGVGVVQTKNSLPIQALAQAQDDLEDSQQPYEIVKKQVEQAIAEYKKTTNQDKFSFKDSKITHFKLSIETQPLTRTNSSLKCQLRANI